MEKKFQNALQEIVDKEVAKKVFAAFSELRHELSDEEIAQKLKSTNKEVPIIGTLKEKLGAEVALNMCLQSLDTAQAVLRKRFEKIMKAYLEK